MYEFWYDNLKRKNGKKAKLYYMDTDSFIIQIKTEDVYKNIAEDVATLKNLNQTEKSNWITER